MRQWQDTFEDAADNNDAAPSIVHDTPDHHTDDMNHGVHGEQPDDEQSTKRESIQSTGQSAHMMESEDTPDTIDTHHHVQANDDTVGGHEAEGQFEQHHQESEVEANQEHIEVEPEEHHEIEDAPEETHQGPEHTSVEEHNSSKASITHPHISTASMDSVSIGKHSSYVQYTERALTSSSRRSNSHTGPLFSVFPRSPSSCPGTQQCHLGRRAHERPIWRPALGQLPPASSTSRDQAKRAATSPNPQGV